MLKKPDLSLSLSFSLSFSLSLSLCVLAVNLISSAFSQQLPYDWCTKPVNERQPISHKNYKSQSKGIWGYDLIYYDFG